MAAPASAVAPVGTVRLVPFGCDPIQLRFSPPEGFEPRRGDGEDSARWSTPSPPPPVDGEALRAHGWLDFITVRARCANRPDALERWAREAKTVHVDKQDERPFATSGDPTVARMRQLIEVLVDSLESRPPTLELRTTYPDGVPPGFIYDKYEGRCWILADSGRVVVEIEVNAPVSREAAARTRLRELCGGLEPGAIVKP